VEALIAAMANAGSSPKTITNALGFLHSIFEHGRRKGWVRANPREGVDLPSVPEDGEIRFLDQDELDAVVRAERDRRDELAPTLALAYLAAAMSGLRQGELIGLRWRDVDWEAARLRVRRSYVRGEFTTPKSRRGSRSVPLADELAAELDRHFQGSVHQHDDLVFAHPRTGQPLDRSKVRNRFKAALRLAACGRSASMISGIPSAPAWPAPASRCGRFRNGWDTRVRRRPRSTRTTSRRPGSASGSSPRLPVLLPVLLNRSQPSELRSTEVA
jgi:integrase